MSNVLGRGITTGMSETTDKTDQPGGTERVRMIVDTEDEIRRAVGLRLLKMPHGTTRSDVVNGILRDALAEELAEMKRYQQAKPPPKRKPKE